MILITGASGFLGSYVLDEMVRSFPKAKIIAAYYRKKPKVQTLKKWHSKVKFIRLDLNDPKSVRKIPNNVTSVIHLASYVPHTPKDFSSNKNYDVNVRGTWNLYRELARRSKVKHFVHASSISVYGDYEGNFKEQSARRPTTDYGVSKMLSEEVAIKCCEQFRKKVCILRFSSVYGWGQDRKSVLPRFIDACLSRETMTIFERGRRNQDFIYVKDAAKLVIRAHKKQYHGVLNAGSGQKVSMLKLAKTVNKVFSEGKTKIKILKKKDPKPSMILSANKTKRILTHKTVSLDRGLSDYQYEMLVSK